MLPEWTVVGFSGHRSIADWKATAESICAALDVAVDFACEHGFEEGCCRGSEGCGAYDGRESLTFNGVSGNVGSLAHGC